MDSILDFFNLVNCLKRAKRTLRTMRGEVEIESVADHGFKMAIMGWVFAKYSSGIDADHVVKLILIHDLAKIDVAGAPSLPEHLRGNRRRTSELVTILPKLSEEERRLAYAKGDEIERERVARLTSFVSDNFAGKCIYDYWFKYQNGIGANERFARQVGALENLLNAVEYSKRNRFFNLNPWWEHAKKSIDNDVILEFVHSIEGLEEKKKRGKNFRRSSEFVYLASFFNFVESLKREKRKIINKFHDPGCEESFADHGWKTALLVWILGICAGGLNTNRMVKVALTHDFAKVDIGDTSPYAYLFPIGRKRTTAAFLGQISSLTKEELTQVYQMRDEKENQWMTGLLGKLRPAVGREIFEMWQSYRDGRGADAQFVVQAGALESLQQVLEVRSRDASVDANPWWENAHKHVDHPKLLEFMQILEKRYG